MLFGEYGVLAVVKVWLSPAIDIMPGGASLQKM